MRFFFVLFFFSLNYASASELVYGVEGNEYHDFVKIDFDKRIMNLPSAYILNSKNKKKTLLGEFQIKNPKNLNDLYKFLQISFKKSSPFKGKYPSHQPYLKYNNRLLTSDSPFFQKIVKLIHKNIDSKGPLKKGISIQKQKKEFKITRYKNFKLEKTFRVPASVICKPAMETKKYGCHYESYTWPYN